MTSRALAGASGFAFSKVLLDDQGNRHVPHYRAVDIVSDNRIAPGTHTITEHRFTVSEGCDSGSVRANVLYRPIPIHLSQERGWDSKDYEIASTTSAW